MCIVHTTVYVPKGTCQVEASSNREKRNPVALAIIELHLSEGTRQESGRQVVNQSIENSTELIIFKILYVATHWKHFGSF